MARSNLILGLCIACFSTLLWGQESKIRDLVNVKGVRSNQLLGYGLVIGLNKTGDSAKSILTNRAAASMISRLGVKVTDQEVTGGSMALVVATAELPPFAKNGDRTDVKLSIIGDAKTLAGGTLILTQLKAGDGQVYASAQGSVSIAQASGNVAQVQTVARVADGATVEREFAPSISKAGYISLSLKWPDFTVNRQIADGINEYFKGFYASSTDISSITVIVPPSYKDRLVEFLSEIENIRVQVQQKAMVVINERTGTVIMGGDVTISPVTISHGDLSISVGSKTKSEKPKQQRVVSMGGTTVGKLVESMTAMGMKPADLISILQTLNNAGALQGELKVL